MWLVLCAKTTGANSAENSVQTKGCKTCHKHPSHYRHMA